MRPIQQVLPVFPAWAANSIVKHFLAGSLTIYHMSKNTRAELKLLKLIMRRGTGALMYNMLESA